MQDSIDRPTRVRWIVVGLLAAAGTIAYLDRIVISHVVMPLQDELGLSNWQAGWMLSSFLIGYGLMQVPMGRLGDVRGIRFVLPTIVVLWSLMTGLTPLAQSFAILFLVRCLFGMAQAGVFPLTVPGIRRWFPLESRTTAQGLVVTGTRAGAILATLAAPFFMETYGWKPVFGVCGLFGVVWAIVFVIYFRERPKEHPHANQAEIDLVGEADSKSKDEPKFPLRVLATNANMWGMSLAQFFGAMGFYLYITWFPTYLREQYGFDMSEAGVLTGAPILGGFLGTAVGGPLVDWLFAVTGSLRWSRRGVWLVGKTSCGVLFLVAAQIQDAHGAVAVIACAAFVSDATGPANWAMVTDVGRRHAGVVYGVQNTAGCVGAGICPLLVPAIVEWSGSWDAVLPVFGCIFFACAASWLWVDATRPIERDA